MLDLITNIVTVVVTAAVAWFFSKRKNNAEAKLAEIQAKVAESQSKAAEKSAELDAAKATMLFYEELINNSARRLNEQVELNNKNDEQIKALLNAVKERDLKIDHLISEIENLTDELKKYKQLNGKT